MKITRTTPILVVDSIEENLAFWETRLGYKRIVEVPVEDKLAFVLLEHDDQEIMLQTKRSLEHDLPQIVPYLGQNTSILYIDVDSIDDVLESLKGIELLVEPRNTFYGTREIFVRDSAGQIIGFAQKI